MKETFSIIPAGSGPLWIFLLSLGVTLFVSGLLGSFVFSSRNMRFAVSEQGLEITGGMYGRTIPKSQLDVAHAKPLDLAQETAYRLVMRTNGAGMPGYQAGWFRLHNGEKCLAFVTDQSRVVYVPTSEGYAVMMSVESPSEMVRALQRLVTR